MGRRFLLLYTLPVTALFLGVIGLSFYAKENALFGSYTRIVSGVLALDGLALYVAFFAIGLVQPLRCCSIHSFTLTGPDPMDGELGDLSAASARQSQLYCDDHELVGQPRHLNDLSLICQARHSGSAPSW